jgi:hypothetical protein
MHSNRSGSSTVPGDPKLAARTLLTEADLQQRIESLQFIICDLLVQNEKLRQHLVADKFLSFDTGHLREKNGSPCKPRTEDLS